MSNPALDGIHLTKKYALMMGTNRFQPSDLQWPVTKVAEDFTLHDLFLLIYSINGMIPDITRALGMEEFDLFWNQMNLQRDPDDKDDIDYLELCWHPDYDILETPKTGKPTDQDRVLGDDDINYWDDPKICEMSNLMSFHGVGSGCPLKDDGNHECDDKCPNETSYGIWPCTLNNLGHLTLRVVPTVEFYPPHVESNREFKRTGFQLTINPTLWCFITSILWELTYGGSSPNEIKGTINDIMEQVPDLEEPNE